MTNKPDPQKVINQYAYKVRSYNAKYGVGYYAHLHSGFYEKEQFPFLQSPSLDLDKLSIERIQHLLVVGQEIISNEVARLLFKYAPSAEYVLDCGSGHGATSIYLAENYGISVQSLTISEAQAGEIRKNALLAKMDRFITTQCASVFEASFKDSEFDGIIGLESFCQMGEPERLYRILAKALKRNGVLVVSDYFCKDESNELIQRFDKYWNSGLTTINKAISEAINNGFRITIPSPLMR